MSFRRPYGIRTANCVQDRYRNPVFPPAYRIYCFDILLVCSDILAVLAGLFWRNAMLHYRQSKFKYVRQGVLRVLLVASNVNTQQNKLFCCAYAL